MNVRRIASMDDADPNALAAASSALAAGGVLVYPTDTLYALGCCAGDGKAASRVRGAKGRDERKPLPLVAGSVDQARDLAATWGEPAQRLAERFWPGPLTLVLPLGRDLPAELTSGASSLAVRVPAARFARALCERMGPLVSTSANRSGETAASLFADAQASVGAFADLLVDAGTLPGTPSTIVDLVGHPRLLRPGSVAWEDVVAALRL